MDLTLEIIKLLVLGLAPAITLFLFLRYGSLIQASEAGKSIAMGDVSFLYEATPKVYSTNGRKIIEIEVKISNMSSKKLGILAIFMRFRPIINSERANQFHYVGFDSLGEFERVNEFEKTSSLIALKNIAYVRGFLWQTSINGVTVRRSFDIVDDEFCKKYPLIMAQIIIYGSSMNYIDKTHFPKYKIGKLRTLWCSYVEQKHDENYNFFERMGKEEYSVKGFKLKQGERILINKDGTLDIGNTKKFFPILKSVINSNMERVIELNPID